MELHKVLPDLSSQEIGEFELDLQYLLRPESYACKNNLEIEIKVPLPYHEV